MASFSEEVLPSLPWLLLLERHDRELGHDIRLKRQVHCRAILDKFERVVDGAGGKISRANRLPGIPGRNRFFRHPCRIPRRSDRGRSPASTAPRTSNAPVFGRRARPASGRNRPGRCVVPLKAFRARSDPTSGSRCAWRETMSSLATSSSVSVTDDNGSMPTSGVSQFLCGPDKYPNGFDCYLRNHSECTYQDLPSIGMRTRDW